MMQKTLGLVYILIFSSFTFAKGIGKDPGPAKEGLPEVADPIRDATPSKAEGKQLEESNPAMKDHLLRSASRVTEEEAAKDLLKKANSSDSTDDSIDYSALLETFMKNAKKDPKSTPDKGDAPSEAKSLNSSKTSSSNMTKESLVSHLLDTVKEKVINGSSGNGSNSNRLLFMDNSIGSKFDPPVSYRLKNIRSLITPELLFILAKAGHGDTIVFAANGFPSSRLAKFPENVVHVEALGIPAILQEVLKLIPVCRVERFPLLLMKPMNQKDDVPVWTSYKKIVEDAEKSHFPWAKLSRQQFYEEAGKAFAIIQTGEDNPSASIIVTKGLVGYDMDGFVPSDDTKVDLSSPNLDLDSLRAKLKSLKDKAN